MYPQSVFLPSGERPSFIPIRNIRNVALFQCVEMYGCTVYLLIVCRDATRPVKAVNCLRRYLVGVLLESWGGGSRSVGSKGAPGCGRGVVAMVTMSLWGRRPSM